MDLADLSRRDHSRLSSEQEVQSANGGFTPAGERESDQEASYARLRSLDEETQERIAKKYYNGTRPWETSGKKHRKMGGVRPNG